MPRKTTDEAARAAGDRRARLIIAASAPLTNIGHLGKPRMSGRHQATDFFTPEDRATSVRLSSIWHYRATSPLSHRVWVFGHKIGNVSRRRSNRIRESPIGEDTTSFRRAISEGQCSYSGSLNWRNHPVPEIFIVFKPRKPLPSTLNTSGGEFSTAKPKTHLEYEQSFCIVTVRHSCISHSPFAVSRWEIYRAKQLPGPGQYETSSTLDRRGGRISVAKPMSDVEMMIKDVRCTAAGALLHFVKPT